MAESILAPCPFCGGKAKALTGFSPINKSYVFCIDCDVSTHTAETLEEAVAVWNRRTAPAGWKLVPVEPSVHMMKAGVQASLANNNEPYFVYESMLAAAPDFKEGAE